MTVSIPKPPPVPNIEQPMIDTATGKLNPEWYRWFVRWDRIWRDLIVAAGGTP